jgi:transcription elongation GreA/GreB family factor
MPDEEKSLTEAERKEIFLALVRAQDDGQMTVPASRAATAKEFGVSERQVKEIEREGLDGDWPPLGESAH